MASRHMAQALWRWHWRTSPRVSSARHRMASPKQDSICSTSARARRDEQAWLRGKLLSDLWAQVGFTARGVKLPVSIAYVFPTWPCSRPPTDLDSMRATLPCARTSSATSPDPHNTARIVGVRSTVRLALSLAQTWFCSCAACRPCVWREFCLASRNGGERAAWHTQVPFSPWRADTTGVSNFW